MERKGGVVEVWAKVVRTGSCSGGGVGGNIFRLIGGSDCCLDLLCRPGLTRLLAPNDMDSRGRSSSLLFMTAAFAFDPALVPPVVVLLRSEAAINRALPR